MSKIQSIQTIRIADRPKLIWVEITTDEGIVGLGESFRNAESVEALIHEHVAPQILGKDSRNIEEISRLLMGYYLGFNSSGAEIRAASAVDIALWDIAGKRHGIPVYEAIGGKSRNEIRVYNTCAGYDFNSRGVNRRLVSGNEIPAGPSDDQIAFTKDAGALAESLLSEGYRAMKIWPFDIFAVTGGNTITLPELKQGLEPFRKIRQAVGDRIEVMCELHSLWSSYAAERICRALEDYNIFWVEDPINKMDNFKALADLRQRVRVPVCGSETLGGAASFQKMLSANATDIVMADLAWCGGLTEGRKIAYLAEIYGKPFAPHDCTGPVTLVAGLHLALHASTAIYQEVVRASLASWYPELVSGLPPIENGSIHAPEKPGLGISLHENVKRRKDAILRNSHL